MKNDGKNKAQSAERCTEKRKEGRKKQSKISGGHIGCRGRVFFGFYVASRKSCDPYSNCYVSYQQHSTGEKVNSFGNMEGNKGDKEKACYRLDQDFKQRQKTNQRTLECESEKGKRLQDKSMGWVE